MKVLGWWEYEAEEAYAAPPPPEGNGPTLALDAPTLLLKPGLSYDTYLDMELNFPEVVMRVLKLAVATGRRGVVPTVDCGMSWITKTHNPTVRRI